VYDVIFYTEFTLLHNYVHQKLQISCGLVGYKRKVEFNLRMSLREHRNCRCQKSQFHI